jgi:hypothetical protein
MNEQYPTAEFLVICRGEWDSTLLQKEKQNVIDQFYAWFDELVDQGKIKRGQRLTSQGNTIGQKGAITDGPFGESKEVIGGYWFVLAGARLQRRDERAHAPACLSICEESNLSYRSAECTPHSDQWKN